MSYPDRTRYPMFLIDLPQPRYQNSKMVGEHCLGIGSAEAGAMAVINAFNLSKLGVSIKRPGFGKKELAERLIRDKQLASSSSTGYRSTNEKSLHTMAEQGQRANKE